VDFCFAEALETPLDHLGFSQVQEEDCYEADIFDSFYLRWHCRWRRSPAVSVDFTNSGGILSGSADGMSLPDLS